MRDWQVDQQDYTDWRFRSSSQCKKLLRNTSDQPDVEYFPLPLGFRFAVSFVKFCIHCLFIPTLIQAENNCWIDRSGKFKPNLGPQRMNPTDVCNPEWCQMDCSFFSPLIFPLCVLSSRVAALVFLVFLGFFLLVYWPCLCHPPDWICLPSLTDKILIHGGTLALRRADTVTNAGGLRRNKCTCRRWLLVVLSPWNTLTPFDSQFCLWARYTTGLNNLLSANRLQRRRSITSYEGLRQPMRVVCSPGTLQVSIAVISTAAKNREEKMRNAKLPSWPIGVAATCNYISEEVHVRLRLISGIQLRRGCTVRIAWIQRRSLNQALAGCQTLVWQVKTCGVTCGLPVIIVGRVLPPKNCLIAKRFHHIWNDLQVRFRIYAPCTLLLLAFPLRYPLSSELLHWYQWIIPLQKYAIV